MDYCLLIDIGKNRQTISRIKVNKKHILLLYFLNIGPFFSNGAVTCGDVHPPFMA